MRRMKPRDKWEYGNAGINNRRIRNFLWKNKIPGSMAREYQTKDGLGEQWDKMVDARQAGLLPGRLTSYHTEYCEGLNEGFKDGIDLYEGEISIEKQRAKVSAFYYTFTFDNVLELSREDVYPLEVRWYARAGITRTEDMLILQKKDVRGDDALILTKTTEGKEDLEAMLEGMDDTVD